MVHSGSRFVWAERSMMIAMWRLMCPGAAKISYLSYGVVFAFVLAALVANAPAIAHGSSETCDSPFIQNHLRVVELELSTADVSHLTEEQKERRARHMMVLVEYRNRCEFPENTIAQDRLVTVFVDDHDIHCALGYLMMRDGRSDLVERIRSTQNTATVQELGQDDELLVWLNSAGLTLAEAARIQPAYCFMNRGGTCLCESRSAEGAVIGVAEATIVNLSANRSVDATISRVHGQGAVAGESKTVGFVDGDVVGRKILIVLRDDRNAPEMRGAGLLDDGQVSCTSGFGQDPKYCAHVPAGVYVDALLSEDCLAFLAAYDSALGQSVCDLGGKACNADGTPPAEEEGGCTGGGSSSVGLLVFACLASQRRSRRTRNPVAHVVEEFVGSIDKRQGSAMRVRKTNADCAVHRLGAVGRRRSAARGRKDKA